MLLMRFMIYWGIGHWDACSLFCYLISHADAASQPICENEETEPEQVVLILTHLKLCWSKIHCEKLLSLNKVPF